MWDAETRHILSQLFKPAFMWKTQCNMEMWVFSRLKETQEWIISPIWRIKQHHLSASSSGLAWLAYFHCSPWHLGLTCYWSITSCFDTHFHRYTAAASFTIDVHLCYCRLYLTCLITFLCTGSRLSLLLMCRLNLTEMCLSKLTTNTWFMKSIYTSTWKGNV